jgi:hypothetical protein
LTLFNVVEIGAELAAATELLVVVPAVALTVIGGAEAKYELKHRCDVILYVR